MSVRYLSAALCAATLLFAAAPQALATQPRIDSMGGGVKSITIEDEVNIFDFPSLLVRYGNMTYLDNLHVGQPFPNGRFGFHFNLGDDTVLAVVGSSTKSSTRATNNTGAAGDTGFTPTGNPITGGQSLGIGAEASEAPEANGGSQGAIGSVEHRYGILFATVLGSSTRFGVMLNILADNDDIEQPDGAKVDQGGFLFDLAVGLGLDLEGSELELSAGLALGFADDFRDAVSASTGQNTDLLEHNSVSHFGLRVAGRWTFDFFNQSKIVAYTTFLLGSQSVEQQNVAPGTFVPSGSYSGINWALGADWRLEPFKGVIVSPGIGIRIAQLTLEGSTQTNRDADQLIQLPFYGVGVDLEVADWIDVRFGASQSVNVMRDSDTNVVAQGVTTQHDTTDVATNFALGVGLHIPVSESTLTVDLNVNPDILINGPYLLTGSTTDQFGLNAAVKYAW
ncbi:MAG: hypothetical protein KC635_15355 [Myxococcales bacterium]|nr:hypothetical protein [Myxococcales bacterium]MCB9734586.1 hypothetical protein [Deltaproteobacteria bacterium]